MMRSLLTLIGAAATYGFAIGSSNSWLYAGRNLWKFPLLILTTAVVCASCYFVVARFLGVAMTFVQVQRAVLTIFRDTAVLLAGLSPAVFFLAMTNVRPTLDGADLGDYPLFQGLNVSAIAVCGCLAVAGQTRHLLQTLGIGAQRLLLVGGWMFVSLLVGGQVCWYMRPFFGIAGADADPPVFAGTAPDFRGARSFYEAVYNLVDPPAR